MPPRRTPFIEDLADVRRIFLTLPEPLDVAYAIGALAGLRTGEVFALRREHVDLAKRRIHVRESVKGPLKDKESRIVPILDRLLPVLADWKKRSRRTGRIIQPLRRDGLKIDKHTQGVYSPRRSRSSISPDRACAGTRRRGTPSPRSGSSPAAPSRS